MAGTLEDYKSIDSLLLVKGNRFTTSVSFILSAD